MEQDKQSSLSDFSFGVDVVLSAVFAVNRTVQIWSRAPGSTGTWFFAIYFVAGSLLQSWYYQVNVEASATSDLISQPVVIGLSLFWFSVHGLVHSWFVLRGQTFHSFDPGVGVLNRLFPKWSESSASLGSDLIVSMLLSTVLFLLRSPILSGWYASLCMWLFVSHYWLVARDSRRRQMWIDSQFEAEHWSEQLKRRP